MRDQINWYQNVEIKLTVTSKYRKHILFCHFLFITCSPKVKQNAKTSKFQTCHAFVFVFVFVWYILTNEHLICIKAHEFQINLRLVLSYTCLWFQFDLLCKSEVRVILYIFYLNGWNYSVKILESWNTITRPLIFLSLQKIKGLFTVFPVSCWNDLEKKVYDNTVFHLKIVDQAMGLNDKWNNWA